MSERPRQCRQREGVERVPEALWRSLQQDWVSDGAWAVQPKDRHAIKLRQNGGTRDRLSFSISLSSNFLLMCLLFLRNSPFPGP